MVIIRLSRFGRKNSPFYRIVAVDSSKKTTGKYLDIIGTWNPSKKELKVDNGKFNTWVGKGSQVSPSVKKLVEKKGK